MQHRTALGRALPVLGSRRVDDLTPHDVAALVTHLAEAGKARESIRKTVTALAMVFDHAGIAPNPARDRTIVRCRVKSRRNSARRRPSTWPPSIG